MPLLRDVLEENLICLRLPFLNEINDTYGKSFPWKVGTNTAYAWQAEKFCINGLQLTH